MYDSYIVTKIEDSNDCRVLAPLRALGLLPDKKSYLAISNFFIAPDCNIDLFDFNFSDNLRTLFAVPKHKGGIVATCGGEVHRDVIEAAVGVVPAATCSSYISSGHINPSVKDIFQPGTWLLNSQGDFLDASTVPALDFSFMDRATTPTTPTTTTTTESAEIDNLDYSPPQHHHPSLGHHWSRSAAVGGPGYCCTVEERPVQQEGGVHPGKENQHRGH